MEAGMTDDEQPPRAGSELRDAIFGPGGEDESGEDSANSEAPESQNSDTPQSASPEPIPGQPASPQPGSPRASSARFGGAQTSQSHFGAVKPEYHGTAKPLAKIVIVNMLLNLITMGFYRFWGKTRIRNYIWSHLRFQEEDFEYSGTGKELFFGFLIALLVLAPILIGFSVLGLIPNPAAQGVLGALQALLFLFLFHFAVYRARRYRMSRTQWRGIRAGQDGAATQYALQAMGYTLLAVVTLGLMYPWMHTALERYKVENTQLGARPLAFNGVAGELFKTWLICWLLLIPTLGISYLWYRAAAFRYFTGSTRYEGLRFESDLTGGQYLKLYFVMWLYGMGLMLLSGLLMAIPIAGLSLVSDGGDMQTFMQNPTAYPLLALLAVVSISLAFLIFVAGNAILAVLFLIQRMIALHCHSITVTGDINFDVIRQSALAAPTRGEGFADALDVGGV
jgi:uncharacterized membrane protein YjgN (DUF898 family)